MEDDWQLRAELRGHGEDVRGVVVAGSHGLATSSRDTTLRLWPADPAGEVADAKVFAGHTNYVGPVVWAPPGVLSVAPDGALVSGSRDTSVIVWHTDTAQPLQRLTGHTQQARGTARVCFCAPPHARSRWRRSPSPPTATS